MSTSCSWWPAPRPVGLLPAVVFVAASCGTSVAEERALTVRDSAGIELRISARPTWPEGVAPTVDAAPRLSFGAGDDEGGTPLSRVTDVRQLSDGRFAVLDGGSENLRLYDRDGAFVRETRGRGRGPGEFEMPVALLVRAGDTLSVAELWGSLSVFDPELRFIRREMLARTPGVRLPHAALQTADGRILVRAAAYAGYSAADAGRRLQDTLALIWHEEMSTPGRVLQRVPGAEHWGYSASGRGFTAAPLPYTTEPSIAAGHDRFVSGSGRTPEIAVWTSEGRLDFLLQWSEAPTRVTSSMAASFREHRVALARQQTGGNPYWDRFFRQLMAEVPFPETANIYQRLRVDALGCIWAERYRPPWEARGAGEWEVFDREGVWLGRVRTPPGLVVHQIGADIVLGVWFDELDVEYIQVREIRPGQRAAGMREC